MCKSDKYIPKGSLQGKSGARRRVPSLESNQNKKVVWDFHFLDTADAYGFHAKNITPEAAGRIFCFLRDYSHKTWGEVRKETQNSKRNPSRHHNIAIPKICKKAQKRFKEIFKDNESEYEEVFSFHLTGKERIFGVQGGSAFFILWFDPDHKIYEVSKRHT